MNIKKIFSFEFLPTFQNRDDYFEKIIADPNPFGRILSLFSLLVIFTGVYGIVMGSFHSFAQAIAAGIKTPLLTVLTLLICFPAFFIIQHVLGSKLKLSRMIAIILSGFVLTSSIIVSFAPIAIFFLLIGSNYYFLQLLHIAIFVLSGIFGMKTVIDALKISCEKKNIYPRTGVVVFRFWIVILAFVGIQLAWVLRPFMGDEGKPFKLFRQYEGNFYTALIYSFEQLAKPGSKKTDIKKYEMVPENESDDSSIDSLFQFDFDSHREGNNGGR
jgi:hypothetical protein